MPELDMTLFSILKGIQDIIHCESASIWLLNETGTELECTHAVGTHAADMLGDAMRAQKFKRIYRTTSTKGMDLKNIPCTNWLGAKTHLSHFKLTPKKLIASPLTARDELLGVLMVINKSGRSAFSRADWDLIKTFAAETAVAIQNTQLYEQQNRINERQSLLNQISRHLHQMHQTLDLDKLISHIFTEVNKAINAESQSIWLVDEAEGVIKCHYTTGPEAKMLVGFAVSMTGKSIVGASVSKKESIMIRMHKRTAAAPVPQTNGPALSHNHS